MQVKHKKLLNEHTGPESQSKVHFCPSFLLVNCITASQSVLSMTRWVLTVLCRAFDPWAPGEGARAPGFDSNGAAEPKGRASATALRCEPSIFSFQHRPSIPQTSARRQTQCTGLYALSGRNKSISLRFPCGPDLL